MPSCLCGMKRIIKQTLPVEEPCGGCRENDSAPHGPECGRTEAAFQVAMRGRQYGTEETSDARAWFRAGWKAAQPEPAAERFTVEEFVEAACLVHRELTIWKVIPRWGDTLRALRAGQPFHPNCDGCARGLPIVGGNHRGTDPWDLQACTASRYQTPQTPAAVPTCLDPQTCGLPAAWSSAAQLHRAEQPNVGLPSFCCDTCPNAVAAADPDVRRRTDRVEALFNAAPSPEFQPVTMAAAANALTFAASPEAAGSYIYPTPEGGIQFEWDEREIEFTPGGGTRGAIEDR